MSENKQTYDVVIIGVAYHFQSPSIIGNKFDLLP